MKKPLLAWSIDDFALAMENAIYRMATPKLIKKSENKISFNGFWRNGDKQNVCVWLDKATWHDAKTGESGGCKDFAKIAFNMGLSEFMNCYGSGTSSPKPRLQIVSQQRSSCGKSVDDIWRQLQKSESAKDDRANDWLINTRGFASPHRTIKSGFANLTHEDISIFQHRHQGFIAHRTALSPQIVVPLRGCKSDEVKNLFFRSITNVTKEEKSRLLPDAGGWTEPDGSPRAFGFPHLIKNCARVIICEGMADYFAVEFLLNGNRDFLPIGAANADGLTKWALWLVAAKFKGEVIVIHQLDGDSSGSLSTKTIGPAKAIESVRCLRENQIHAHLFNWPFYLRNTSTHLTYINDIADSLSAEARFKECSIGHLQEVFSLSINTRGQ